MTERYYPNEEVLQLAYNYGKYEKEQGKPEEPIKYVIWVGQYRAQYRSEDFYQQVIEWYKAGYAGKTLQISWIELKG